MIDPKITWDSDVLRKCGGFLFLWSYVNRSEVLRPLIETDAVLFGWRLKLKKSTKEKTHTFHLHVEIDQCLWFRTYTFLASDVHLWNISFCTSETDYLGHISVQDTEFKWNKFQTQRLTCLLCNYANLFLSKNKMNFRGMIVHGRFGRCTSETEISDWYSNGPMY